MDSALDVLEQRLDKLNNLLGPIPDDPDGKSEDLADSLMSADTLISSAMSGRPNMLEAVNRIKELEHLMAPTILQDDSSDIKAKEVYVKTIAPELAGNFEMLDEIKKLEPTLGAEYFRNIPDVGDNLQTLQCEANEFKQKNEMFEESLTMGLQRYDRIQQEMRESLKQMSERIEQLEERLKQRLKSSKE